MWVQRIGELVGRVDPSFTVDRSEIEAGLQTGLPDDYFELAVKYGEGVFCHFIFLYDGRADSGDGLLAMWRYFSAMHGRGGADGGGALSPYPIFEPGEAGLISWGGTDVGDLYFWYATPKSDPNSWPVVVKASDGLDDTLDNGMAHFEMSASEFLWRVLADREFTPFGVANLVSEVQFTSPPGLDSSHGTTRV